MVDFYSDPEKFVTLHNNIKMPILGIGTSHHGGYSHDALVYAVKDCGYRHIDTAKRYGCEIYIAQAIKESTVDRHDIFLTTKCWPTDYGKEKVVSAIKGSCDRLNTDYIDLYLLHWPDVPTGYNRKELINETWRALELMYDEGVARAIGVSNFLESHLECLLEECSVVPHVNQCEFHPFNNPKSLRQMCAENSIVFEGYSPLAKGKILSNSILTNLSQELGRKPSQILIRWCIQNSVPTIPKSTQPQRVFENSQGYSPFANGTIFSDVTIVSVAEKLKKTCSQVVIRWNIQNRVPCIPKSTKEARLKQNSEVFGFELSSDDMRLLDSLPQGVTAIDRSTIQEKIDTPQPDGYKLKFITKPPKIVF